MLWERARQPSPKAAGKRDGRALGPTIVRIGGLAGTLLLAGCATAAVQKPVPIPTAALVSAAKPAATYFVHALDTRRFSPARLRGQPDELVELVLIGDQRKHDFTSPSLDLNLDLPPGQVQTVVLRLPTKPGSYAFWSAQPGDRQGGMIGHFDVQPAASAAASG